MISIVEVERRESGDIERIVATIDKSHGKAEFHAQLMCNALNRAVTINSNRYYKVSPAEAAKEKEAA